MDPGRGGGGRLCGLTGPERRRSSSTKALFWDKLTLSVSHVGKWWRIHQGAGVGILLLEAIGISHHDSICYLFVLVLVFLLCAVALTPKSPTVQAFQPKMRTVSLC